MTRRFTHTVRAALALAVIAAFATCSDSTSDSPQGDATVIDNTSVASGIEQIAPLFPVCSFTSALQKSASADGDARVPAWLATVHELRLERMLSGSGTVQFLTGTKPADQLGSCGGRITYPTYSHSNGVTTGTFAFQDYCTTDSETGERSVVNGTISFVNNGTPSASGPITNFIEADSPGGVTFITRDANGATLSSQKFTFTNYRYTAGVPGGAPTASNPNDLSVDELTLTDQLTNKSYRETDYTIRVFETASGGEQMSITGRGHRSNGDFFDVATSTPLVTDSQGNTVSGAIRFTGANGSNAVMTFVPGAELQATMTVNGTAVTNVPPCK